MKLDCGSEGGSGERDKGFIGDDGFEGDPGLTGHLVTKVILVEKDLNLKGEKVILDTKDFQPQGD